MSGFLTTATGITGGGANSGMALWRRMSVPLKDVVVNAQQQCWLQDSKSLDDGHVFAGLLLLAPDSSNAFRLLTELGLDVPALAGSLRNSGFISGNDRTSPSFKSSNYITDVTVSSEFHALVRQAGDAATAAGQSTVGTEHLLTAFLESPSTFGFRVLSGFGITLDKVKELLDQWANDGLYVAESTSIAVNSVVSDDNSLADDLVYNTYRWARFGYMLTIFLPLLVHAVIPGYGIFSFDRYLAIMNVPISIYIAPYVLSLYAVYYLLRTRSQKLLMSAAPRDSMAGLTLQFMLSIAAGSLLCLATLPMIAGLVAVPTLMRERPDPDLISVIFCVFVFVNSIVVLLTHWLLTFNVRARHLMLMAKR